MLGAVSGFTKALARERENVLVKVVDFAASRKKAPLADVLIDETSATRERSRSVTRTTCAGASPWWSRTWSPIRDGAHR